MTTVRTEAHGPVLVVTIDRPAVRNAVDRATAGALADAFRAFDADDEVAVAVLTGAGGTFCAGADLHAVAAGEGYAVAGGLELALWCDLRVVAADAVFGVLCRRVGVPLVDLGTIRLPRLIGHSRAMDLILTGRQVAAEEALAMGLANRVVPTGTALEAGVALARELAAFPQACLRADRASALEQWDLGLEAAWRNELRHGAAVLAAGDALAGARRFAGGAGRSGAALPPAAPDPGDEGGATTGS